MFKKSADTLLPTAVPRVVDFLPAAPNRYSPDQVLGVVQDTAERWLEQHQADFQKLAEPNTLAVRINASLVSEATIQLLGRAFTGEFADLGLDITRADLGQAKIEIMGRPVGEPAGELLAVTGLDFALNVPTPQTSTEVMERFIKKGAAFSACQTANAFVRQKIEETEPDKLPSLIPVFLCNPYDVKWNSLRWSRTELTHSIRISEDGSVVRDDHPDNKQKASFTIPSLSAVIPWELAPGIDVGSLMSGEARQILLVEVGKIDETGKGLNGRLEQLASELVIRMFGPESKFSLVGAMFKSQRSQWQLGIETALVDGSSIADARVATVDPKRLHT